MTDSIYDFTAIDIDGNERSLAEFRGQALLIVNVASRCGFTSQYEGLEVLYRSHQDAGFSVLGFPCNQFGRQEPGDEQEIQAFCTSRYDVTFPMFSKVEVIGDKTHPLFQWLKVQQPGVLGTQGIKWNFTKFLVNRQGQAIKRYAPTDTPQSIARDLPAVLLEAAP